MVDVVLVNPEIPPNTGNVIRLCANTGARLHLVEPLGFSLSDRQLKRAGLDYHELADVRVHASWQACLGHFEGRRRFAFSSRGVATAWRSTARSQRRGTPFLMHAIWQ